MIATYPLSYAQQSLVPPAGGSAINVPAVVRTRPPVPPAEFERILRVLTARHEALRTTVTGDSQQVSADSHGPGLTVTDHSGPMVETLGRALLAGSERPFAVVGGELARAELHHFGDGEQVFVLWLHHIVSDLVSVQVLAAEVEQLLAGAELGPAGESMGQVAERERALVASPIQWKYWEERLRGVDLRLGLSFPDGTGHQMLRPALPPEPTAVADALGRLATEYRTTPTTVLAAAVVAAHADGAEADEVAIGLTISGRDHPGLRSTVGCLADQIPVVVRVGDRPTFRELLGRVREALLDAYDHRLPLGLLLPLLDRPAPVFGVNLNFLPPQRRARSAAAAPVAPVELPYGITKQRVEPWWLGDASLAYRPRIDARGLAGELEGDAHLMSAEEIRGRGARFSALLAAVAADPEFDVVKGPR